MIRAHVAAVKALLAGLTVYVTRADTTGSTPYVVLHPDSGAAAASTLTGVSDTRLWRFQTTCVGSTVEQASWLAEKVETRLLDIIPTVPGRSCFPIRKDVTLTVARDEDLTVVLFTAADVWSYLSVPA